MKELVEKYGFTMADEAIKMAQDVWFLKGYDEIIDYATALCKAMRWAKDTDPKSKQ